MSALDHMPRPSAVERMVLAEAPIEIDALREFWRDPAPFLAEQAVMRGRAHAAIDAGMAPLNAKQAARWAAEESNA